jgi:hypothetical protein
MADRFSTPTATQDIALSLVFEVMDENQINRTWDEYEAIAKRLPPLKTLHFRVNEKLRQRLDGLASRGLKRPQICIFKAGHKRIVFEDYPRTISIETIRTALDVSGLRVARRKSAKRLIL